MYIRSLIYNILLIRFDESATKKKILLLLFKNNALNKIVWISVELMRERPTTQSEVNLKINRSKMSLIRYGIVESSITLNEL